MCATTRRSELGVGYTAVALVLVSVLPQLGGCADVPPAPIYDPSDVTAADSSVPAEDARAAGASGPSVSTGSEPWKLEWSDEFNGAGSINAADWTFEVGRVRNNEAQYYTKDRLENARQENGMLVIEARKEAWEGAEYTSASVTTQGKHEFHYGRIEVRAKVPGGRGTWPAIWTKGVHGDWPTAGEIDIMEHVGFDPDTIHCTIHTEADRGGANHATVNVPDADENFHVYAVEWFPDRLDFYMDLAKVWTFENDGKGDTASWPFRAPQYLLLNLAIGGSWGGQQGIDDSIFPRRYYIDYVRYYRQ